jgi:hypothetical protein
MSKLSSGFDFQNSATFLRIYRQIVLRIHRKLILNRHSKALVYPEHGIQPLDLMASACKGFLLLLIALRNMICTVRPFRFARLIHTTVPEVVNAIRIPAFGYSD